MYLCLGWNIFSEFGLKLVRHLNFTEKNEFIGEF